MNDELRRSAAHILVADVESPELTDDVAHHVLRGAPSRRARTGDHHRRSRTVAKLLHQFSEPCARPVTWRWRTARRVDDHGRDRRIEQGSLQKVRGRGRSDRLPARRALRRAVGRRSRPNGIGPAGPGRRRGVDAVAAGLAARDRRPAARRRRAPRRCAAEPGGRSVTSADRVIAIGPEGGWTPDEWPSPRIRSHSATPYYVSRRRRSWHVPR